MQVTIKELEATKVELTVTIPANKVEAQLEKKLKELGARAQLKGFRPGKVPATLLKGMLGDRALGEALNDLLGESYPEALAGQQLRPLDQGSIEKMDHEPGGDFTYVAVVEVAPRVEPKEFKNLAVKRPVRAVEDEDLAKALEQLRHEYANWAPVEEGGAAEGDQLLCDIQETDPAGTELPDRLYRGIQVELGKGQYGAEFDGKMSGVHLGETRFFDITNPADDPDPEVAGKVEYYRVLVHEIKRPLLAELDDEFAKEVPPGFETLDELKERVREDLRRQLDRALDQTVDQRLIAAVMERNPVEVPEKMIAQQLDSIIERARQGTDNPIDEEIVRRSYREEVTRNLAWSLVSTALIRAEKLEVTPEELDAEIARLAASAGQDPKAARLQLKRANALDRLFGELQERKLMGFLRQHAQISDEDGAQG
ncbi:MAG: trigger factor [bacterium]|nr:trigger factor [bacterium]